MPHTFAFSHCVQQSFSSLFHQRLITTLALNVYDYLDATSGEVTQME